MSIYTNNVASDSLSSIYHDAIVARDPTSGNGPYRNITPFLASDENNGVLFYGSSYTVYDSANNKVFRFPSDDGMGWNLNHTAILVIHDPGNTDVIHLLRSGWKLKRLNTNPRRDSAVGFTDMITLSKKNYTQQKTLDDFSYQILTDTFAIIDASIPATAIHQNGKDLWIFGLGPQASVTALLLHDGKMLFQKRYENLILNSSARPSMISGVKTNNSGSMIGVGLAYVTNFFDTAGNADGTIIGQENALQLFDINQSTGELTFLKTAHEQFNTINYFCMPGLVPFNVINEINRRGLLWEDNIFRNNGKCSFDNFQGFHAGYRNMVFSPDDSLLYCFNAIASWDNVQNSKKCGLQIPIFINAQANILANIGTFWSNGVVLGPQGEIFCGRFDNKGILERCEIVNPNNKASKLIVQRYSQKVQTNLWPVADHYLKLDLNSIVLCDGDAQIDLLADSSFSDFYLIVNQLDTIVITAEDLPIIIENLNLGDNTICLSATSQSGYHQSVTNVVTLSELNFRPSARFGTRDTLGCQWVGVGFANKSTMIPYTKNAHFSWMFENGIWTTDSLKNGLPNDSTFHTFTSSGTYSITLIANNGVCSDTFTLDKQVNILAAPRPGFTLSDSTGCSPFYTETYSTYPNNIDSIVWSFEETKVKGANALYTFGTEGEFQIIQKLYGPTGCVTSATSQVVVKAGIHPDSIPRIKLVSFLSNDSIEVSWIKVLGDSIRYHLYYGNKKLIETAELEHVHHIDGVIDSSKFFTIRASDYCSFLSQPSLANRPPILYVRNIANEYGSLYWTSYENWPNGVSGINVYAGNLDTSLSLKTSLSGQAETYQDYEFFERSNFGKCYQINAENIQEGIKSKSNIVCAEYQPVIWVPNAFTPNEDGLNDIWKIYQSGLINLECNVFNRWGNLVYSGVENVAWDGKVNGEYVQTGEYLYRIKAYTKNGREIARNGFLVVAK